MQQDYEEFAIHWVPRHGTRLAEFGAGWTGWCAEHGMSSDVQEYRWLRRGQPEAPGMSALHGLHAPLKPGFKLAIGQSFWSLEDDLISFAQSLPTIQMPRFEVTVFDGRVVLVPSRPNRPILRLIRNLDAVIRPFEAQPVYSQCAGGQALAGVDLPGMQAWTDFNGGSITGFQVPLTDRMELQRAFDLADSLTPRLKAVLAEPLHLMDVALMGNPGRGRPWRLIERFAFSDEPSRREARVPRGMACNGPELIAPLNTGLAFV